MTYTLHENQTEVTHRLEYIQLRPSNNPAYQPLQPIA